MKSLIKSCCICVFLALSACNPSPPAAPTKSFTEKTPVSTETAFIPSPTETPTENPKKTTFIKTFGDTRRDRGINLIETNDGGFAIVGYTSSFGAGQEDVYLVRTDPYGEMLWYRTYGGEGTDNGWDILQTEDNGFMILGFTDSFGAGEMDIYLIRTDNDGKMLWERTFGGEKSEYGWALASTPDGGFVLAGQTDSIGEGDKDGYLVKVDAGGNALWSQTYGGPEEDRLYSVDRCVDGGFVLTGTTKSFGADNRNAYLIKTNNSGALEWMQVFGENLDDVGHSVHQTMDKGYIVTGYTKSFGAANYDIWMIKADETGQLEWQKFYGETRDDRTIYGEQTEDGGYIFVGYSKSFGAGGWDVFLVRADITGEVLWHKTFGGRSDDTGYTVIQASDQGFILTGETYSFGEGGGDMILIKVDKNGEMH